MMVQVHGSRTTYACTAPQIAHTTEAVTVEEAVEVDNEPTRLEALTLTPN
jgi:hypothetical protein